jgi:hypothetical protein
MPARHKVLRPRWRLSYRSGREMLGFKSIAEIAPATPEAEFIFGQIELKRLERTLRPVVFVPKMGL